MKTRDIHAIMYMQKSSVKGGKGEVWRLLQGFRTEKDDCGGQVSCYSLNTNVTEHPTYSKVGQLVSSQNVSQLSSLCCYVQMCDN